MAEIKRLDKRSPKIVKRSDKREERDMRARENALKRPASERELAKRPDRIRPYLIGYMDEFIFDEFSESYLKTSKLDDLMSGVPVPLRKEDLEGFRDEKGLSVSLIGENMARVMGIDPKFRFAEAYMAFLTRFLGKRAPEALVRKAKNAADGEDFDAACICFRAALVMRPDDLAAMYGYARVCRAMYNKSNDAEYIGNFKAESLDYLESLTELHPRFGQGWYYLGYMYLNLGLYTKAYLAWESFLPHSRVAKDRREVRRRMEQIRTPMEIERGYNAVLSSRWEEGIRILVPFRESVYKDWWPLWYYLGEAYLNTGCIEAAEEAFLEVLKLNGTHTETMEELISLYDAEGRADMAKKYRDKIALIRKGTS
ncbi:MAG: tetratricopeptide repeat protein [Clostridiales Family XIII bacterium]|jgi:tetratricopeptide (TPR) repeat protein|nr:tetratricopeptide repeat protein [Clostridiales Family XIII bacterium]